jgi:hypothetical protein
MKIKSFLTRLDDEKKDLKAIVYKFLYVKT